MSRLATVPPPHPTARPRWQNSSNYASTSPLCDAVNWSKSGAVVLGALFDFEERDTFDCVVVIFFIYAAVFTVRIFLFPVGH